MFGKNFYPTPKKVIRRMLRPYYKTTENGIGYKSRYLDLSEKTILEPSAGKGDILDFIKSECSDSYYNNGPEHVFCIEINDELRMILAEKGHRVIADDFLNLKTDYHFDIIIMNPPFNKGAKHLIKAWKLLIKGDIVCLLNAETIRNPHTREKKLLAKLIKDNGKVEFIGDCFNGMGTHRKTAVEVALVRLHKDADCAQTFEFNMDKDNIEFPKDIASNIPAVRDVLLSYEHRYRAAVEAFKIMNTKIQEFLYLANGICTETRAHDLVKDYCIGDNNLNGFITNFNEIAWHKVLRESKFEKYLTTDVRRQFSGMFSKQAAYQFTKENMINMFNALWLNKEEIMKKCVEEVFDTFTKYHKENRCHIEGWVTNDMWKVNKRVILPYYIKYGEYATMDYLKTHGDRFKVRFSYLDELRDIDKAMCYLKGVDIGTVLTINEALEYHFVNRVGVIKTGEKFNNTTSSTYFNIKFWKKGTLHLEFRDEWLWEEFNKVATKCKNWLPPKTKAKRRRRSTSTATNKVA